MSMRTHIHTHSQTHTYTHNEKLLEKLFKVFERMLAYINMKGKDPLADGLSHQNIFMKATLMNSLLMVLGSLFWLFGMKGTLDPKFSPLSAQDNEA